MTIIEKLDMNVKQANSDFVAIKEKIVEKGVEVADSTRTSEYASKVDEVYEAGRKSEYDRFWDNFQKDGRLFPYQYATSAWDDSCFYPKYDLTPRGYSTNIWAAFYNLGVSDLSARLKECGVILDTSTATHINELFYTALCTVIPLVSALSTTDAGRVFRNCRNLITIEGFEVHENLVYTNTFTDDINLENLTIIGTIGQNGFNVQWSTKLSHDSWVSIINALSATTSGLSITGSLTSVNTAFETSEGAGDGSTSEEWLNLIATKSNWTINLV